MTHPDERYFFERGIRFECTRCGRCCTGTPGEVLINRQEAARLVEFLGTSRSDFECSFAERVPGGYHLREKRNGDCIFYRERACTIHPVRPTQCRTYPFWVEHLRSPRNWRMTCRACPGIGRGRLFARDEILSLLASDMERTGALPPSIPRGRHRL